MVRLRKLLLLLVALGLVMALLASIIDIRSLAVPLVLLGGMAGFCLSMVQMAQRLRLGRIARWLGLSS